ncbi:MAG TPA: hypothetical protein VK808_09690 [Bacteroidia bacterium]|nr:hypothetical protein [Bacteroidia bacterium]
MKEYMLLVRNEGDGKASLSPEELQEFVKKCEVYIGILKKVGRLVAAQPLIKEGKIISKVKGDWVESPVNASNQIQVGYYHIRADTLEDAITIAKGNPEFEYVKTASIEVRPIKMKEESTGFVYPGE